MKQTVMAIWRHARGSLRDLAPIVLVIGLFQFAVLREPLAGAGGLLIGALVLVIG